ncbi:MAG: dienelactone hydrolase family protein [Leptospiraceae bacterium]|nr:dienelactone hydrolase family protein [Leptospiraceae bacterium]
MNDFLEFEFSHKNISHKVFKKGNGPGIIIIHELPGMVKECVNFARNLEKEGFTVYLPLLFGEPNKELDVIDTIKLFRKVCISKEFDLFSNNKTSPVVEFLKGLCKFAKEETSSKGVGAIGMCLTGGFVIPMVVESSLLAPVLSQPSLPLNPLFRNEIGCSKEDYETACSRIKKEKIKVLGFKFSEDILSHNDKFKKLETDLMNNFEGDIIDSSLGNSHKIPFYAHAVFTKDFVEQKDHPTYNAYLKLISYFKEKLLNT